MTKNNRAARAARFLMMCFDVVRQTTTWNFHILTTATLTTTPQINYLIGWMKKNNDAARAARFLIGAMFWCSLPNNDVNFLTTRREHSMCQGSGVSHIFILIIHNREKVLSIVNVMEWRRDIRENSSLPVAVRVSKTRVLKLPDDVKFSYFDDGNVNDNVTTQWFHWLNEEK